MPTLPPPLPPPLPKFSLPINMTDLQNIINYEVEYFDPYQEITNLIFKENLKGVDIKYYHHLKPILQQGPQ